MSLARGGCRALGWLAVMLVPACALDTSETVSSESQAAAGRLNPNDDVFHEMVVTANPIATRIGEAVLHDGGNAIDAAVAIQLALGAVEAHH